MRLSGQICMLALVISGALLAICVAVINLDHTRTQQQSELTANYLADLTRQRTTDLLLRINASLRDAATLAGAGGDKAARADRLSALLARARRAEPGLIALYVVAPDGSILAAEFAPTLRGNELLPACLQDERLTADQAILKPAFASRTDAGAAIPVVCYALGYRESGLAGAVVAVLSDEAIANQYRDLLTGAHGVITLRDEAGRTLARASAQPEAEATSPTRVRRIEVPAIASIALSGVGSDLLAGWRARSTLLAIGTLIIIVFLWLAALTVRACQRREVTRLERLAAAANDLPGAADRDAPTRRLVQVASTLADVVEVASPEESNPPNGTPERRWSLSVLRPDLVRIGTVTLRQRHGTAFSSSDLALLRVLARTTETAVQHAAALEAAERAAQGLREELQGASAAIEATQRETSDAIFKLDRSWRFIALNRNAERLFGEYAEDIRNRSIWQVFPELAGSSFEQECRRAVRERHEVVCEVQWVRNDVWLTVHAYPHADGLAVYMQDISRLVSANDKLRQAAKMEAIGRLTGGIAHNFNNTLQIIQGCIESLELDVPASNDAQESLDAIKRAADSAGTMTRQLLAFARRQPLSPQVVDVARLVDGLDALLRGTLGAAIKFEIRRPGTLWPVRVDPVQLQDAIINLSINGRDAMPSGGRLTIEAANLPVRKPELDPFGEIQPGNYVVISVSDTGKGIPKELLGNVFEPFFSTKGSGRGTGLGLAIVYGFVNQSGGHVKITSEVGRGTTVRLFLPSAGTADASAGEPQDAATAGSAKNLPGGAESILVVEDTKDVRRVVVADLRRLGYRVGAAPDGAAALDLIEHGLDADLLLTDVQLPGGMDGVRLAEQIRQQRPQMAVLFMSGFIEDLAAFGDLLDPQTNLMRKPFSRGQLAARVRMCLDEARKYPGENGSVA